MGILVDLMAESLFEGAHVPHTGPEAARWVSQLYGSGRAASRATGIPESTLRGWRHGVTPKGAAGDRLLRLVRGAAPGYSHARNNPETLTIQAVVQYSSDRRDRRIHPGRLIPAPIIRRALTEWVNGNDRTAETLLNNAIFTHYFEGTEATIYMQPSRVWFE